MHVQLWKQVDLVWYTSVWLSVAARIRVTAVAALKYLVLHSVRYLYRFSREANKAEVGQIRL